MSGAIPLLSLNAFMAWTGRTFYLYLVLGSRTMAACYYSFNNQEKLLISQEGFWVMEFVVTEPVRVAVGV
jgi:hypothetical protein